MKDLDKVTKTSQELWNDYFFLTEEMSKFLEQQEMELFYELMQQREALQKIIDEVQDDEFLLSIAGQQFLQKVRESNQSIALKLQYVINNNRNQHNVSRAYDGLGTDATVGNRMDRQS